MFGGARGACGAQQGLRVQPPRLPEHAAGADGATGRGLEPSAHGGLGDRSDSSAPGGWRPAGRTLTGLGTDAPGLTGLRPSQALHPDAVVPARLQAVQQHLWEPHPHLQGCTSVPAPRTPSACPGCPCPPHPHLPAPAAPTLPPRTSMPSSSPLGEAGEHRTRYWVAPAEGCQVRRMVLGVTVARVSPWGGGRGPAREEHTPEITAKTVVQSHLHWGHRSSTTAPGGHPTHNSKFVPRLHPGHASGP